MPAEGKAAITFDNVSLQRGGRQVFSGLNLVLNEKRIGFIGNNGSGKSSLLRLVNGLLLPDSGSVTTCGLDSRRDRKQLPAVAGFLFQNPDHQIIFPSVGEEIGFGLRERGHDRALAQRQVLDILAAHDCVDWFERPVHELSEGQKQLVCILSVLVTMPRTLLLDEPFSSLDLPTRYDLLARLAAQPQQIVMASHDLDLLANFDRVIWLENGAVKRDGGALEVVSAYREFCIGGATHNALAAQ